MGSIGGLLGVNGGVNGTGMSVTNPTNTSQINNAYTQSQNALQQQQQFLTALQGQNGIQNQSNTFNQLQGVANGTGPNPAAAQLAQATSANVANQAALMAGQRGSAANPALIARQAAQQGAQTQQQSAGQAATLQANQSLNALGQMGSLSTSQVGQQQNAVNAANQFAQGEQGSLIGAQQGFNQNQTGLAQSQMQGQQSILGGVMSGVGGALGLANGGMVPSYADGGGVYAPTDLSDTSNPFNQQPAAISDPIVQTPSTTPAPTVAASGPQSKVGQFMSGMGKSLSNANSQGQPNFGNPGANALYTGMSSLGKGIGNAFRSPSSTSSTSSTPSVTPMAANNQSDISQPPLAQNSGMPMDNSLKELGTSTFAKGGKVPALVSPGERYLPPKAVEKVAKGEVSPLKAGEKIPGKAKVKGNSYANDTVKKDLDEGGIVLPRSVMQSKNPHMEALKFVKAITAKQRHGVK